MGDIDLERLAGAYSHRRMSAGAARRAAAAADLAGLGPGTWAVDVGGGRGDHAEVLTRAGGRVLVVDRSPAMVGAARARGMEAVVGDGSGLPLRDGSAHLAYFHLSLHYGGWPQWLGETVRVLRPGGWVVAWTFAAEHFRNSLLARWFPSIVPIDEARFPHPDLVMARLWALGLKGVTQVAETETVTRRVGDWRAAVEAGFVSTLQLLTPEELASGLARLAAEHPDPDDVLRYRLWYRGISGRKPAEG